MRIIRKRINEWDRLKESYNTGYKDGAEVQKELCNRQAEQIKSLQKIINDLQDDAVRWKIKYEELETKIRGELKELIKQQHKTATSRSSNNLVLTYKDNRVIPDRLYAVDPYPRVTRFGPDLSPTVTLANDRPVRIV